MKKVFCLILALMVTLVITACGGDDGQTTDDSASSDEDRSPAASADEDNSYPWNPDNIGEHSFMLAHGLPAEGMTGLQYNEFAVAVEELSGGKMKIDQRVGGTLLTDTETLDAVRAGTVDFIHSMGSFVSGTVTDISPMTIAGYYGGDDWQGFAERIHDVVESIYADHGIKYLGALAQGYSVIANSSKRISAPDDVKGMTFRASGTWLSKTVEAWGGAATVISLADLADAFNRKTVDGVMTGWNIIAPFKIYEVAEYITTTTISEGFAALLMNADRWNEMNADEQALLEYAGRFFEIRSMELANEFMVSYRKEIEDSGRNQIYDLTPAEEQEFMKIAYGLFPQMEPELGPKGLELINTLKEINGIS
jgi:TRAP-type C4-dicarboxylate transport system substrate-binding protein